MYERLCSCGPALGFRPKRRAALFTAHGFGAFPLPDPERHRHYGAGEAGVLHGRGSPAPAAEHHRHAEPCRPAGGDGGSSFSGEGPGAGRGPEAENLWIIGGGSIYAALLSRCRRVYLTRVETRVQESDTFFPNLDKLPGWEVESCSEPVTENGHTYRFLNYINTRL